MESSLRRDQKPKCACGLTAAVVRWGRPGQSAMSTSGNLKMVTCPGCEAKVFIPGDLPPLSTEPCKRCGHPIMMPMQLRQFELRSKIASGGQGKVYRAFDTVLERLVAVKIMRKELENDLDAL